MSKKEHPRLKITQENGFHTEVRLDKDLIRIGRSNEADIIINEQASSRIHAEISNLDGECYLKDLESRNGTTLNGKKIREERLRNQDQFSIGRTQFVFIDPSDTGRAEDSAQDDLSDDDWDRLSAQKPREKEKDQERLLTPYNIIVAIVSVSILGFLGLLYQIMNVKPPAVDKIPVDLPIPQNSWYGYMGQGNQRYPDKITFRFQMTGKEPLELSYKVWDNDQPDEMVVFLNNQRLDVPPETGNNIYSTLKTVGVPPEYLQDGENFLVFDNLKVPPKTREFWGVGEVAVNPARRYVCNPESAEKSYVLGKQDFDARELVKANLYNSVRLLQLAIDNARECKVKPDFYVELSTLFKQAKDEHQKKMEELWFCVDQNKKTRRFDDAKDCLSEILERVTDETAEENVKAMRELRSIDQKSKH